MAPPASLRSHTTTVRSQAPEYSTRPPTPSASAFTAALWRAMVATSASLLLCPSGWRRLHALTVVSAEPVYTCPSADTATALMASSCAAGTDSAHRRLGAIRH